MPKDERRWTKQEGFLINRLHGIGFMGAKQAVKVYGAQVVAGAFRELDERMERGEVNNPPAFLRWLLQQFATDGYEVEGEGTNG
jgi:hypothetical protein